MMVLPRGRPLTAHAQGHPERGPLCLGSGAGKVYPRRKGGAISEPQELYWYVLARACARA